MGNCPKCSFRKWLKTGRKNSDGIRFWKCARCGKVELGDYPFERGIPSILYLDIETSLSKYYNFGQRVKGEYLNPSLCIKPYYIICWSASWVGEEKIYSGCVTQAGALHWTDKGVLEPLAELMDRADVVAGHNVRKFDIKRINTRLKLNNIPRPEDYKVMDSLLLARQKYAFESNTLNEISQVLGFRPKDAMSLEDWIAIAERGDPKVLNKMLKYNRGDVRNGKPVMMDLLGWTGEPRNFGQRTFVREPKDWRKL